MQCQMAFTLPLSCLPSRPSAQVSNKNIVVGFAQDSWHCSLRIHLRQPFEPVRCVLQRWGALWGRGQRRHSSASSDDGEAASTNAQGTAEVAVKADAQSLQHAAGPAATTRWSSTRADSIHG